MIIRVEKLRSTLKLLEPAISKKTTLPILKNILLGDGKATASNLELSILVDMPEASTPCLLPHKEVSELLETIPGFLDLNIEPVKKTIQLSWTGGKASYPTENPIDYPHTNHDNAPIITAEVDGTALIKGMAAIKPYAATEESQPVLHGIAVFMGEKVRIAAADGFRLACDTLDFSYGTEGTLIMPLDTVDALDMIWNKTPTILTHTAPTFLQQLVSKRMLVMSVWGKENAHANIGFSFNEIGFSFSGVQIISTNIQGNFPDYKQLIPVPVNKVTVMGSELYRAILKTKDIAKNASGIVRLEWSEKEMIVSAIAEEAGEVSTTIPADAPDGPGHVAINYAYLSQVLKDKNGIIIMGTTSASSPVLFEYPGAPVIVVMPLMAQWESPVEQK